MNRTKPTSAGPGANAATHVTVVRKVAHHPADFMDLVLDFDRYPDFVPGVSRIRATRAPGENGANNHEVEAFFQSPKFSGTIRVLVEADPARGVVLIKPRFGPFKVLAARISFTRIDPTTTEAYCDLRMVSTIAALNTMIQQQIHKIADAYADVFTSELARRKPVRAMTS